MSGWDGVLCDRPCPDGSFGKDCEDKCQCFNNAACDPQNGNFSKFVFIFIFGVGLHFPLYS